MTRRVNVHINKFVILVSKPGKLKGENFAQSLVIADDFLLTFDDSVCCYIPRRR